VHGCPSEEPRLFAAPMDRLIREDKDLAYAPVSHLAETAGYPPGLRRFRRVDAGRLTSDLATSIEARPDGERPRCLLAASKPGSTAPPEACRTQLSDRRLPPRGLRLRRLAAVDKGTQSRGDCARCRASKWTDDLSPKAWSGQRAVGDAYAVVAVRGRTRGHGSRSGHYGDRGDNAQEECSHTCLRSWLSLRRCRSYMPSGWHKRWLGPGPPGCRPSVPYLWAGGESRRLTVSFLSALLLLAGAWRRGPGGAPACADVGWIVGSRSRRPALSGCAQVGCGHMMVDGVSPNGLRPLGL
jgi:hypothetical protein